MDADLSQLIPFLRDRNPQVRHVALSNLVSHTPKESPCRNIFLAGLQSGAENDVIRDLKLLTRDQLSVAHDAFRALVNLSDSALLVAPLSEVSFLTFIASYIIHPDAILADLASMMLSNLTASPTACSALVSLRIAIIHDTSRNSWYATQSRCGTCAAPVPYPSGESREVLALPLLVDAFVQGAAVDPAKRSRKGRLDFLASVFANLSTVPCGRDFFLTAQASDVLQVDSHVEYPLAKIVMFTEHENVIRRGGVASTIKNCAFHEPAHQALLSPSFNSVAVPPSRIEAPGIDVLPCILLPLAGSEEFNLEEQEKMPAALQFLPGTKQRESDGTLRLTHVETLLLLCTTKFGRDLLRKNGVYEIVRTAHLVETVDKILEYIERLVNLLIGEEEIEQVL